MSQIYAEPFADNAQISSYLVSKEAKKSVTVALCGDGGDELFGGYTVYNELADIWRRLQEDSVFLGSHYKAELYRNAESAAQLKTLYYEYAPELKQVLLKNETARCVYDKWKEIPQLDEKRIYMLMDQKQYLVDDNLVKVDRAGGRFR